MDPSAFENTFNGIVDLNGTEGPNQNIFEPKYQAREQAEILATTIKNILKEDKANQRAQEQVARLYMFIGNTMSETEEDKDALKNLLRAYKCIAQCIEGTPYDVAAEPMEDLKSLLSVDKPLTDASTNWCFVASYAEILNALGVFFANRDEIRQKLDDSRQVLHVVEKLLRSWDRSHKEVKFADVPLQSCGNGKIDEKAMTALDLTQEKEGLLRLRHRMDGIHTNNLYYLAQCYQAKRDLRKSSEYCHLTLANQLVCRKEFSKKDWATNVIHLSGFYSSEADFGAAKYCLDVGSHVMPKDRPDEETMGLVWWSYGKFYRNRLRHYAAFKTGSVPMDSHLKHERADWWTNFDLPDVPGPSDMQSISTYEQAKAEFILARRAFEDALKLHPFDGCCTDHIEIHKDLVDLYSQLMAFEPDFLRQVAMQMRRVELLRPFSPQLNFNAYGTLVRQLLFDVGDMTSDLLDLRIRQKEKKLGKVLSDAKINELQQRAQTCFIDFVESWKEGGKIPTKIDKDSQPAFLRALMRIARLEPRKMFKTPQEEYAALDATIKRYNAVLDFADNNNLSSHPDLKEEVRMSREMADLLPTKQRDIWRTFNRS